MCFKMACFCVLAYTGKRNGRPAAGLPPRPHSSLSPSYPSSSTGTAARRSAPVFLHHASSRKLPGVIPLSGTTARPCPRRDRTPARGRARQLRCPRSQHGHADQRAPRARRRRRGLRTTRASLPFPSLPATWRHGPSAAMGRARLGRLLTPWHPAVTPQAVGRLPC